MARKIELEVEGSVFTAELLETDAPVTCKRVLEVLPVEGEAVQCRWSGGALFVICPALLREKLDIENGTIYGAQGDVLFIDFRRPGYMIDRGLRQRPPYPPDMNYQEFFVVYSKEGAQFRGWDGPEIPNRFAKIKDDLDSLEETGERIWKTGIKRIAIRERRR